MSTNENKASPQERQVFNVWKKNKSDTGINLAFGFKSKGLAPHRLEKALNKIIERHERLRSNFYEKDGIVYRKANPFLEIHVQKFSSKNLRDFVKPFDLEKGALIRAAYFDETLLLDFCHAITDGFSMAIFFKELDAFYSGKSISYEPTPIFSCDEKELKENNNYWSLQFKEPFENLCLPRDKDGEGLYGGPGNSMLHKINGRLTRGVQKVCKELLITNFVYYFSAFVFFLHKTCSNNDVVTSTNLSCRSGKTARSIGLLANVVPFRFAVDTEMTVADFLRSVDAYVRSAILRQQIDAEKLFDECGLSDIRDFARTLFTYEHSKIADIRLEGNACEYVPVPSKHSQTDFNICFFPFKKYGQILLIFRTDLFSFQLARTYLRTYVKIAEGFLNTSKKLCEI
ncbi:MAG: hypothetical protein K6A42_06325 [Treponema sp.]|nr:hypothetical protein [Treponema sp.]